MSIHLGNTRLTKMPNGQKELFFATAGSRLVYPDALFRPNATETTTYSFKNNCQQVAMQFNRTSLYRDTRDSNHEFHFTEDRGWSTVIAETNMSVIWRYRTELKFLRPGAVVTVGLGYANVGIGTAVYMNGVNIAVGDSWAAYDFEFTGYLAAGGSWAPVIRDGTGYIAERNAIVTFRAD